MAVVGENSVTVDSFFRGDLAVESSTPRKNDRATTDRSGRTREAQLRRRQGRLSLTSCVHAC